MEIASSVFLQSFGNAGPAVISIIDVRNTPKFARLVMFMVPLLGLDSRFRDCS
jgi:hypothetical protein